MNYELNAFFGQTRSLDPGGEFEMSDLRTQSNLLLQAGRLLLQYNEATEAIVRALTATARALTEEKCHVSVAYGGLAVSLGNQSVVLEPVRELRYNMTVQAKVYEILARVRRGELDTSAALIRLNALETETADYSRWVTAVALGIAAASLAVLLGADVGAAAVAGVATGLGLLARQALGQRHFSLLALPLTAAFLGAILGGLAIRLDWTQTPELALVVPALMLVPGPHLINGLLDLIDNHVPMALARLGLAAGILFASAVGIILGVELVFQGAPSGGQAIDPDRLNVVTDMMLAGIASCGFAMFYHTSWAQLWMPVVAGMAGHGLRFVALEAGCGLLAATFIGGLTVGIASALMARSRKLPVAMIGFAAAVTMIPGLHIYRALTGILRLAQFGGTADPEIVTGTLGYGLQGCLVVGGLVVGLVLGARAVQALAAERPPRTRPCNASAEAAPLTAGTTARARQPHAQPACEGGYRDESH